MGASVHDLVSLLGGGALLYLGAEWLVRGAAGFALSLGISQLTVGLTVVAFGTSAPELVVSVQAAVNGRGAMALGNVLGSNIANLGLILGLAALVKPARVDGALRRRELPMLVASTLALPLLLARDTVAPAAGAGLVLVGVLYTAWMAYTARSKREVAEAREAAVETVAATEGAGAPQPRSRTWLALTALVGFGLLLLGSHLFVDGATAIARALGMSEWLVGMTLVAVGTSLPELATSLVAARRGHSDIAVGNAIGSNIFNVLLCLGAASALGRVSVPRASVAADLAALGALTLLGALFLRTERTMQRWEGAVLFAAYGAYMVWRIAAGG